MTGRATRWRYLLLKALGDPPAGQPGHLLERALDQRFLLAVRQHHDNAGGLGRLVECHLAGDVDGLDGGSRILGREEAFRVNLPSGSFKHLLLDLISQQLRPLPALRRGVLLGELGERMAAAKSNLQLCSKLVSPGGGAVELNLLPAKIATIRILGRFLLVGLLILAVLFANIKVEDENLW